MDWLQIVEKCIWFGCAAIGFAVLFNVPLRTLPTIFLMGAAGGFTKQVSIANEVGVVFASLFGSIVVGVLSIHFAHKSHTPPPVIAIPSVIPMVPGIFAYKMILGLIKLAGNSTDNIAEYNQIMAETINSGLKTMFILMCLAGGVAVPMLITRNQSAKHMKLRKK